ncbi:hypothetical protein BCR33DRAFT_726871 [Rhizoclosmatium globosum]|uniref:Uncharacterized protein n=1 Tax=Rhizoclosmatium globosum TaxID=329046 RepID=A0A1Y2AST7_9FUNG|nr:hypothetical protein BCR33DRAFT_726871 [Rhizoclosmatium globosum]|eukprot:ORY25612.1 hypothetical protein BCR33DRAFT_726871 [Rhizoclosmatium globosum]
MDQRVALFNNNFALQLEAVYSTAEVDQLAESVARGIIDRANSGNVKDLVHGGAHVHIAVNNVLEMDALAQIDLPPPSIIRGQISSPQQNTIDLLFNENHQIAIAAATSLLHCAQEQPNLVLQMACDKPLLDGLTHILRSTHAATQDIAFELTRTLSCSAKIINSNGTMVADVWMDSLMIVIVLQNLETSVLLFNMPAIGHCLWILKNLSTVSDVGCEILGASHQLFVLVGKFLLERGQPMNVSYADALSKYLALMNIFTAFVGPNRVTTAFAQKSMEDIAGFICSAVSECRIPRTDLAFANCMLSRVAYVSKCATLMNTDVFVTYLTSAVISTNRAERFGAARLVGNLTNHEENAMKIARSQILQNLMSSSNPSTWLAVSNVLQYEIVKPMAIFLLPMLFNHWKKDLDDDTNCSTCDVAIRSISESLSNIEVRNWMVLQLNAVVRLLLRQLVKPMDSLSRLTAYDVCVRLLEYFPVETMLCVGGVAETKLIASLRTHLVGVEEMTMELKKNVETFVQDCFEYVGRMTGEENVSDHIRRFLKDREGELSDTQMEALCQTELKRFFDVLENVAIT